MTARTHQIDARALLFVAGDRLWTGPIRNEQALRSLEQHCIRGGIPMKVMWSQADLIAADAVLRVASERCEYEWGGKRGYSVTVARLRPAKQYTGAGDAACGTEACVKPAAQSQDTPPPPFYVHLWRWLIGATE